MDIKNFVTYEQALALKKLGFDMTVNHYYDNNKILKESINNTEYSNTAYYNFNNFDKLVSAPTLAEASNWLEKKYGLVISPCPEADFVYDEETHKCIKYEYTGWICTILIITLNNALTNGPDINGTYSSSEEALSAGISECINFLNS